MQKRGKQVALYLGFETIEKLNRHCRYAKMSKSGLVEEVLNKYLDEIENLFAETENYTPAGKFVLYQTLVEIENNQLKILDKLEKLEDERKAV